MGDHDPSHLPPFPGNSQQSISHFYLTSADVMLNPTEILQQQALREVGSRRFSWGDTHQYHLIPPPAFQHHIYAVDCCYLCQHAQKPSFSESQKISSAAAHKMTSHLSRSYYCRRSLTASPEPVLRPTMTGTLNYELNTGRERVKVVHFSFWLPLKYLSGAWFWQISWFIH